VSGETDVKQLEERDDSLSACWEVAKAGKCYLAEGWSSMFNFRFIVYGLSVVFCHFVFFLCLTPGGEGRQLSMRHMGF